MGIREFTSLYHIGSICIEKKKLLAMKHFALILACASIMSSMCQGQYATLNIDETGTKFTQESIRDEENNLLINYVPAHNGRMSTKLIFDGDSDLMLMVQIKDETCTVQRTVLPTSTEDAFAKIKANKEDLTIRLSNNKIPVIRKDFSIAAGYEITNDQLPKKFQPHCPPGFIVYTAHTADMGKATKEDPYVRNNVTNSVDMYDYNPQLGGRQKRDTNCIFVDGTVGNTRALPHSCDYVDHHCGCTGCGCPNKAYSFECRVSSSKCTYLITGCKDPSTGMERPVCIWHMTMTNLSCDACCMTMTCGSRVPKCPGQ